MLARYQRNPGRYVLCGFLVIGVLHVIVAGLFCQVLPHSRYRNFCSAAGRKHDLLLSQERSDNAASYLSNIMDNDTMKLNISEELTHRLNRRDDLEFCVGIVTVMRPTLAVKRQYVLPLLAQLVPDILSEKQASLMVVNAEAYAEQHLAIQRFAKFVPSQHAPAFRARTMDDGIAYPYLKEKFDYGHALQQAGRYGAKYVLLLQDDVMPHAGFLEDIRYLIRNRLSDLHSGRPWAYLRLFYPERWSGFQNSDVPLLLVVALCTGSLLVLCTYCAALACTPSRQSSLRVFPAALVLPASFLVLSVVLMINRYHLQNVRLLFRAWLSVTSPADRCCIPAVLYQRHVVGEMSRHLVDTAMSGSRNEQPEVDLAIADFAAERMWPTYHALPNLVTHHGRKSSLPKLPMDDVT